MLSSGAQWTVAPRRPLGRLTRFGMFVRLSTLGTDLLNRCPLFWLSLHRPRLKEVEGVDMTPAACPVQQAFALGLCGFHLLCLSGLGLCRGVMTSVKVQQVTLEVPRSHGDRRAGKVLVFQVGLSPNH